ncbi:phosphatidate cytidylyltransferase [Cellvibrio japonicus]|uniref:Phosphatidate cytidylyltransferase n=1 Tax=Cellvibrio japonicus (strain Ueda107) TaxID=498211 RepID=B3PBQ3_CELJU|nr:phosphatidate cytidylyltransferase [Cellvibrio japonicus]ACE83080.1 phosphatidate cytidylyltransferase [Cellvibrio japonicus Ueda107]QEI11725.1 phosphatidate cytidylyltransferase [Cellvibrio japonicus]QEI15299.1 phosphatidate cytidylyltransferase [Cellvibrio japonicus]QEI18879.1 phosphatidate cytidylyltransferase [Cellvibrio japonicus]
MLKQRLITALVLAIIFLASLFVLPAGYFSFFIGAVLLIGAWEWSSMSGFQAIWQRCLYAVVLLGLMLAAATYFGFSGEARPTLDETSIRDLLVAGCVWWALALLLVQGYPSSAILWGNPWVRLLMGIPVLLPAWVALVYLRQQDYGAWLVLLLILVVALADSGGYFAGRRFGKHKLAPHVSPGKTWEGFAGGLVANLLLVLVLALVSSWQWLLLLVVIVPTSLVSVLGDLLESMVKRHAGLKDSGNILPGHGGILDRIDGITAGAPVFALALLASGMVA